VFNLDAKRIKPTIGKLYPYAVLIIAALTRLPQMTWRSFDGDEGATLLFSDLPYRDLFLHLADLTIDRHPLLFYVPIRFWRSFAGDTDVALRLFSALFGMLTVAVVYQIGVKNLGRGWAATAALLFALNPLVIYQHQDVRMYAPALFLMALAVWLAVRVRDVAYPQKGLLFLIIAVSVTAAVYLHVLATTVLPIVAILLLRDFRQKLPWAETAVLATIGLGILPYFYHIVGTGNQGSGSLDIASWYRTLLGGAKTLFDNQDFLAFSNNELFFTFLLLGVTGLALLRNWKEASLHAFWLLAALVQILYVILRVEFFTGKPFVFAAIPLSYLLVIAFAGDRFLRNILPLAACVALFIGGQTQLWQPGNLREDFRSAAVFVQQQATEQDVVIVHLSWYQSVLGQYLTLPLAAPFSGNVQSTAEVADGFAPFLDADVIWLVQAGLDAPGNGLPGYEGDPDRLVQTWLESRFPVVTEVYPAGVSIKAYALHYRLPTLPVTASPLSLSFSDIHLVGYRLADDRFPTNDTVLHPPSTWIPITLYWTVAEPTENDLVPVITLEDEQGAVWGGPLTRENDLRRFHPPAAWLPGEIVRWDFDIVVNPQISPGAYKLVVRVADGQTMMPVIHEGGQDWFILQPVTFKR